MTHEIPTAIRVLQLKLTTQIHIHIHKIERLFRNCLLVSLCSFFLFYKHTKIWERDNWKLRSKRRRTCQHLSYTRFCLSITLNTTSHKMNRIFENSWRKKKNYVKPKTNHFTTIAHKHDAILNAFWHTEQERPTHLTILFSSIFIPNQRQTKREWESIRSFEIAKIETNWKVKWN